MVIGCVSYGSGTGALMSSLMMVVVFGVGDGKGGRRAVCKNKRVGLMGYRPLTK